MSFPAHVFALALAVAAAPVQASTDAQLRDTVRQRLLGDRTGACVAVAVVDGTVTRAYVCADPADEARIDARTAFEIGSVSKTLTATLLAQLILAGQGSLDDPLAAWLPEGSVVPEFEGQPIRLRDVVSHTSGLPALPPGVAIEDAADPYAAMDEAALLQALARCRLDRAPGSRFEYSNFAMMLLSSAVARRAGVGLEELFDARLFAPLGMDGAYLAQRPDGVREAEGHAPNRELVPAWHFAGDLGGVGGVRATLDDMVRYVQAQLDPAATPLADAIALTQQPVNTDVRPAMAMNWLLAPLDGRRLLVHEGGTGGFSSFVGIDRERGRGVVVLSDTALTALGGLGNLALPLIEPKIPLGKPRKAVDAPAALIDALAGRYQLQGAMAMTLSRRGKALVVQAEGQPAFEMGYDDAGDFYPLAFDALLTPTPGGDGFAWSQGGGVMTAVRLDPPAADVAAAPLHDYEGVFRFGPPFAITVFVRDGKLYAQGTGQGALEIHYAAPDLFAADSVGAKMRFERDGDGKVVALRLMQGGAVQRAARE